MRRAKLLGVIHNEGGPLVQKSIGDYTVGSIIEVVPQGNKEFPWKDTRPEEYVVYFRTEELEFLIEKEWNPDDYL